MASIPSKNTKPELIIRKALHALGFRYRLHVRGLPGSPDMVFPKYRAVIQVNGCFWHGHDCVENRPARSNKAYWLKKIDRNKSRDKRNSADLLAKGWRLLIIWECAIRGKQNIEPDILISLIENWLLAGNDYIEFRGTLGLERKTTAG